MLSGKITLEACDMLCILTTIRQQGFQQDAVSLTDTRSKKSLWLV